MGRRRCREAALPAFVEVEAAVLSLLLMGNTGATWDWSVDVNTGQAKSSERDTSANVPFFSLVNRRPTSPNNCEGYPPLHTLAYELEAPPEDRVLTFGPLQFVDADPPQS